MRAVCSAPRPSFGRINYLNGYFSCETALVYKAGVQLTFAVSVSRSVKSRSGGGADAFS